MPALLALLIAAQNPSLRIVREAKPGLYEPVIRLPRLGNGAADRAATAAMDAYVHQRVADLKKALQDPDLKDLPGPFSLDIRPVSVYRTSRLTSVALQIYTFTGGAHGMTYFETFTFGQAGGKAKRMPLSSFFRTGADYRSEVTLVLLGKLRTDERADWVQQGEVRDFTSAQLERFVVRKEGLRFLFPPYDLGPYAVGTFEIDVTPTELGVDFRADLLR